jgi:hypothetical protein
MARTVIAVMTGVMLGGCIGFPVHVSSVRNDLPSMTAPIVAGETDRATVRSRLGEPLIWSEHWRFDAFRITERNVGVIVFGGGIPVPVWDKEEGYILVAYDQDGRAADVQYGLRSGGSWAGGESGGPASVTITARDLQLRATGKETFLAVPPSRRDQYWQSLPSGTECRVVIGAPDSISDAALLIDGQPGPPLPKTMYDTLMPIRLAPGRHRIEVLRSGTDRSGVTEIQCAGGETHYAALQVLPGAGSPKHSSIEVVTSTARPDWIEQLGLLIWGNGHWLVEAEPTP